MALKRNSIFYSYRMLHSIDGNQNLNALNPYTIHNEHSKFKIQHTNRILLHNNHIY